MISKKLGTESGKMDVDLVVGSTGIAIYMPPCKTVAEVGKVYF